MNKQEEKAPQKIPLEPCGETHFFLWLENARPILNSRGLCRKAGISYSLLNKHYYAMDYLRQNGTKTWKQVTLPNKHFYAIVKAFMTCTNTIVTIGDYSFQMTSGGIMVAYGYYMGYSTPQIITENEFNALF